MIIDLRISESGRAVGRHYDSVVYFDRYNDSHRAPEDHKESSTDLYDATLPLIPTSNGFMLVSLSELTFGLHY